MRTCVDWQRVLSTAWTTHRIPDFASSFFCILKQTILVFFIRFTFMQMIQFTCLKRIIDNGGSVTPFLRNSLKTKQIILIYLMQSLTLIYGEKLGKRMGQKFHLSIKSELLKRFASLLRRLHNTGAEFVDKTNTAFIFDLKLVTVTPFAWCP